MPRRVAQAHDERVQVIGEASCRSGVAALVELVEEGLESLLGVAGADRRSARRSTWTASPARPARTATRRRASTGHGRTRRSPTPSTARSATASASSEQLRGERLSGLADLWNRDRRLPLGGLHPARAKPVAQPALIVAQPTLVLRPTLIPGTRADRRLPSR